MPKKIVPKKSETGPKILVYGVGNPGRGDDGLGIKFTALLEASAAAKDKIRFETNYQLNIEDALSLSESDVVIFIDAAVSGKAPFHLEEIEPSSQISFTTHEMSPQGVLALCAQLYGRRPKAYSLAIRGYKWDMKESLSKKAAQNLSSALEFMKKFLDDF